MLRSIILLSMLIVSGCAIIGVGEIGEAVYKTPDNSHGNRWVRSKYSRLFYPSSEAGSHRVSPDEVEAIWGDPKDTVIDSNTKKLTFNNGLRWRGIILLPLLPLPFAVPVGNSTVTFNFENDVLLGWTIHDSHYCLSYSGFNLIPLDPEGKSLGFQNESRDCQWHGDMTPYDGEMACKFMLYDKCYKSELGGLGTGKNLK